MAGMTMLCHFQVSKTSEPRTCARRARRRLQRGENRWTIYALKSHPIPFFICKLQAEKKSSQFTRGNQLRGKSPRLLSALESILFEQIASHVATA